MGSAPDSGGVVGFAELLSEGAVGRVLGVIAGPGSGSGAFYGDEKNTAATVSIAPSATGPQERRGLGV